jgi:hypothetical protein
MLIDSIPYPPTLVSRLKDSAAEVVLFRPGQPPKVLARHRLDLWPESFGQLDVGVPANFRFVVSPDGKRFAFPWVRVEGKWTEGDGLRMHVQTEWFDLRGRKLGAWRCSFPWGLRNVLGWDSGARPVLMVEAIGQVPKGRTRWRLFSAGFPQGRDVPMEKLPAGLRALLGVVPNPESGLEQAPADSPSWKDFSFRARSPQVGPTDFRIPVAAPQRGLRGWYDENTLTVRSARSSWSVPRPQSVSMWTNVELSGWPIVAVREPRYRELRGEFKGINSSGRDPYIPSTIVLFDSRSGRTALTTDGVMAVPLPAVSTRLPASQREIIVRGTDNGQVRLQVLLTVEGQRLRQVRVGLTNVSGKPLAVYPPNSASLWSMPVGRPFRPSSQEEYQPVASFQFPLLEPGQSVYGELSLVDLRKALNCGTTKLRVRYDDAFANGEASRMRWDVRSGAGRLLSEPITLRVFSDWLRVVGARSRARKDFPTAP